MDAGSSQTGASPRIASFESTLVSPTPRGITDGLEDCAAVGVRPYDVTMEVFAEKESLVIRRMLDLKRDYEQMVGWRNQPHVRYWWDPDEAPLNLEGAIDEYRPATSPDASTTACIVELGERPVGFMQFYRLSSYAAEVAEIGIPFEDRTWGVDILIGESDEVGRGLGTRMMSLLCGYLEEVRNASSVVLTTDINNYRAIRCYEKAGFTRDAQVLDTDTRNGERIRAWLMIRMHDGSRVRRNLEPS